MARPENGEREREAPEPPFWSRVSEKLFSPDMVANAIATPSAGVAGIWITSLLGWIWSTPLLIAVAVALIIFIRRSPQARAALWRPRNVWVQRHPRPPGGETASPSEVDADPPQTATAQRSPVRQPRLRAIVASLGGLVLGVIIGAAVFGGANGPTVGPSPSPGLPSPSPSPLSPTPSPSSGDDIPLAGTYVDDTVESVEEGLEAMDVEVKLLYKLVDGVACGTVLEQSIAPEEPITEPLLLTVAGQPEVTFLGSEFVASGYPNDNDVWDDWRPGHPEINGELYEGHIHNDQECLREPNPWECEVRRETRVLGLDLGRDYERFRAVVGMDSHRSRVTDKSLFVVEVDDKVRVQRQVGVGRPIFIDIGVVNAVRIEIYARPWRTRQVLAIGNPRGVTVGEC